ncbi:MAG: hypothetical protein NTZ33_07620 [Bacteroidetes bacterium]|nr:hypothetical protein [Bacteroidota bacterium]
MNNLNLVTIYSSNFPVDCHILKGRLITEGINCFIYDENVVWIHPFRAVAIGGVKLKIAYAQFDEAIKIINNVSYGILTDNEGDYSLKDIFNQEFKHEQTVLNLRKQLVTNPYLLNDKVSLIQISESISLDENDIKQILAEEKEYQVYINTHKPFILKDFINALFYFDKAYFKSLRKKSAEYQIERDLVIHYSSVETDEEKIKCPECNSYNHRYGNALDNKPDLLFLIFSFLIYAPFPLLRKKHHCFDCGNNF